MSVWGWVQAIATGWFVLSIVLAVAWALVGRRIFRTPPQPPQMKIVTDDTDRAAAEVINEIRRWQRTNGRGF